MEGNILTAKQKPWALLSQIQVSHHIDTAERKTVGFTQLGNVLNVMFPPHSPQSHLELIIKVLIFIHERKNSSQVSIGIINIGVAGRAGELAEEMTQQLAVGTLARKGFSSQYPRWVAHNTYNSSSSGSNVFFWSPQAHAFKITTPTPHDACTNTNLKNKS